jgi:DNA polymerase-3 subunit delta'
VTIWSSLVGQDAVVEQLSRAADDAQLMLRGENGPSMTHAWLFTGPPGSGRSTAATCFAAALVCSEGGCGFCQACRTAPLNGHADVDVVSTSELTYGVDDARELVRSSSMSPVNAPWHVIVIEDADRLTERAVNVLLKALEEPPPHTVWILCAPSVEDVLPTIVSRTRHVNLATPSTASVAQLLIEAYGVDTAMASFAARASQGHIGRARALAKDEHARMRRQEVLRIPLSLHDIPGCFASASNLLGAATDDAKAITEPLDAAEQARLESTYGAGAEGVTKAKMDKLMKSAQKDLNDSQKKRATRTVRDQLDRALVDLLGLYRDVLMIQLDSPVMLINDEMRPQLSQLAAGGTANDTGRRLEAIEHTRAQIRANVAPLSALESLMVELKDPWIRTASA